MSAGVTITGMDEIKRLFQSLSDMDRRKFFMDEFTPVAKTVENVMRAQTPIYRGRYWTSKQYSSRNHARGNLRNSIGKKVAGEQVPVVYVNLNRKRAYDAWYDHIVVGGHAFGSSTQPPNPIVQRTWELIGSSVSGQLESRIKNKLKLMLQ